MARHDRIVAAAKLLDEHQMIRFHPESGSLAVTDLGRTASHFYIQHESVETFNRMILPVMPDDDALNILCHASEFVNVKVRPEELKEVEALMKHCPLSVKRPVDESAGKVNVLIQAYISRARVNGFTLVSDTNYVAQNGGRVARALFEIALKQVPPLLPSFTVFTV